MMATKAEIRKTGEIGIAVSFSRTAWVVFIKFGDKIRRFSMSDVDQFTNSETVEQATARRISERSDLEKRLKGRGKIKIQIEDVNDANVANITQGVLF